MLKQPHGADVRRRSFALSPGRPARETPPKAAEGTLNSTLHLAMVASKAELSQLHRFRVESKSPLYL